VRERQFDTGQVQLNYAEGADNGPPFVVLHGGAGRWQYSEGLLQALEPTWHLFAPDLRGHGKSSHTPGAYRLHDYVTDMAAVLEQVVSEPAVIFGHSLGGEVGVMLAAHHPGLPRALIVGDSPLSTRNHGTEEPSHRAQNVLWHGLVGKPESEIAEALKDTPILDRTTGQQRKVRELFGEDHPWYAHQATSLHLLDPDMLAAVLAGPEDMLQGYDPEALLPAILCPVLLLQADPAEGGVMRDEEVALALQLMPNVQHVLLRGIGHPLHSIPKDLPRVLEAIDAFTSRL
jgi:pimeloyl-ACP methyl ester carboxylesterase